MIGVIAPGARAAINSTRSRRVGVRATNLTIRSGADTRAIQDLDAGVDVYGCPASSFVEVVEHELASGAHLQEPVSYTHLVFGFDERRGLPTVACPV